MSHTTKTTLPPKSLQRDRGTSVAASIELSPYFTNFLNRTPAEQKYELNGFAWDRELHGLFVNQGLSTVNRYLHADGRSGSFLGVDNELILQMRQTKSVLEQELIDRWLPSQVAHKLPDQVTAAEHLSSLAINNQATSHKLHTWLAEVAPVESLMTVLREEVLHRQAIDIELTRHGTGQRPRHSGSESTTVSEQLGAIRLHHTLRLRQYLERIEVWDRFDSNLLHVRPWFTEISSNIFRMTVTRPGFKLTARGHYLMTEALIHPLLHSLLKGMNRLRLCNFESGVDNNSSKLDKENLEVLIVSLILQEPISNSAGIDQLLLGAQWAIRGTVEQYDRILPHCRCHSGAGSAREEI